MVNLKEIFSMLSTGQFSNIVLSNKETDGIEEKYYEKIINLLNLGIVELYKRFKLLEQEVDLYTLPEVTTYYLRDIRVASSTKLNNLRYILEPDDYEGSLNIIEITSVYDTDGNNLVMNNRYKVPAIMQKAHDTLKITGLTEPQILNVVYHAHPPKIVLDQAFDLDAYVVAIPDTILECLLNYVAFNVYKPMGANNSTANADQSQYYQQQYELSCQKFELYGLDIQDDDRENNFESEGWV